MAGAPQHRAKAVALIKSREGATASEPMKLLGDWNWCLPHSLHWLPQVGRKREAQPAEA